MGYFVQRLAPRCCIIRSGVVTHTTQVPGGLQLTVDRCQLRKAETLAVRSTTVKVGDMLWWSNTHAFITPAELLQAQVDKQLPGKDYDIKVERL